MITFPKFCKNILYFLMYMTFMNELYFMYRILNQKLNEILLFSFVYLEPKESIIITSLILLAK